jgi:competence protein ComEC
MLCCGLAAAGWLVAERPDILISRDARLVGVMTDNDRVISKARGDQFTADIWAENDGQPVARDAAAIYRDGVGNLNIIWAEDTEPKYTWVLKNSRRARSDG